MKLKDLDLTKITDVEIEGMDMKDYPDFSDAFISYGYYKDRDLTELELDYINDFRPEFIQEQIFETQLC